MSLANHLTVDLTRFPDSDGVPLDSAWERDAINLLVHLTRQRLQDRQDFYAGGNMFIYFDPDDPRKSAGPDYFYVSGVERGRERRIWAVWVEENRFPDAIIELLSPSTARFDRGKKKTLYEKTFKTPEYFIYDPDKQKLFGWRLVRGKYKELEPNQRGWLWSEQLGVWIGTWEGSIDDRPDVWLRFYDRQGRLVPTAAEEEAQRAQRQRKRADEAQQRANDERQRANDERQRADDERQRANEERQRANDERQRAEAAETEIARLKSLLKKQKSP